jgi:hypothetical protein
MTTSKVWQGWFIPTPKKPLKAGNFIVSEIEANPSSPRANLFLNQNSKRLVISVPAQIGKAHLRNKLRRQIRNFVVDYQRKGLLPGDIMTEEKGLWIRISPYYRAPKKMEFENWKTQLLQKIENLSR